MLGAFVSCKVRNLPRVKRKLNQTSYYCILQHHMILILSGMRFVAQGFIFMQDNDPKHTNKLCQRYIKRMYWPVQSADLNLIELVWDELDRKVRAKQPTSVAHLWQLLQESREELSSVYFQFLGERMPRIYEAVIASKRWSFWWTKTLRSFLCVLLV